jgi:hypothetical protein
MIEADLKNLMKSYDKFLRINPKERSGSVGFVRNNLKLKHLAAARFMARKNGLIVDSHNLSDLIENYDLCHELYDRPVIISSLKIKDGRFNPLHLMEFFRYIYCDENEVG